jgi:hypothetical protein
MLKIFFKKQADRRDNLVLEHSKKKVQAKFGIVISFSNNKSFFRTCIAPYLYEYIFNLDYSHYHKCYMTSIENLPIN